MAQEILEKTLEIPEARSSPPTPTDSSASPPDPSLSRSSSFSRLNAGAPEFVPRVAAPPQPPPPQQQQQPRMVKIPHGPPPQPMIHVFHSPHGHGSFEYYGTAGGGGGFGEQEGVQAPVDPEPAPPARGEGLSDEVIQKITKQATSRNFSSPFPRAVEYYFSDVNLATTEHLMRFISKDPEGFVPVSVIASFKKIKALVHNNSLLATALRTSSKLVVSDDGKKVRRQHPFTVVDVEELQARIVVAENLPEDHCYQNLMKIFSAVGSVKTIRTCYPQTPNGPTPATNRSAKMDMLFGNRLHAFVEYETVEDAEKAVAELNDGRNWRSGLRVRLLHKCMTRNISGRGRKGGHEADGLGDGNGEDEDVSISNQHNEKHVEEFSQSFEASHENVGDENFHDREGGARRGRGRGRGGPGGRGRGRGQYHNNRSGGHAIGTPPSSHQVHIEQPAVPKPPPGPRMPDGTRGFTIGRGKPLASASTS